MKRIKRWLNFGAQCAIINAHFGDKHLEKQQQILLTKRKERRKKNELVSNKLSSPIYWQKAFIDWLGTRKAPATVGETHTAREGGQYYKQERYMLLKMFNVIDEHSRRPRQAIGK